MLLVNRKPSKFDTPKRFNLGGLIKKKMPWKRDELKSCQLEYSEANYSVSAEDQPLGPRWLLTAKDGLYTNLAPEDPYNLAITECVSLLASDMTSHHDENDSLYCGTTDSHYCTTTSPENLCFDLNPVAEERIDDYRVGGYYPVKIGDQFLSNTDRYRVLRKLGWGHFLTVWLAVLLSSGSFVALKIVKSGKNYTDAARDEIKILQSMRDAARSAGVVHLLDSFDVDSPFGVHVTMVFELMGENMLHLIYKQKQLVRRHNEPRCQLVPMDKAKQIVYQVLLLLDSMHKHGIVHTDLKPENVLLLYEGQIPDSVRYAKPANSFQILPLHPLTMSAEEIMSSPVAVKIADLGNATFSARHFTNNIQTRQYRAPEVILKYKQWGALADVWLAGCLIFELLTGDYLFDPHDGAGFTKDEDHMAQIIELLGEFPSPLYIDLCELGLYFFDGYKCMRNIKTLKYWGLMDVLVEKYGFSAHDNDVKLICDLILKCLRYNLADRYDCGSLLKHPWFTGGDFDQKALDRLPNANNFCGFTREEGRASRS